MGVAGAIVVACAVIYALTFLPALLGLLGRRIDLGAIPLPQLANRPGMWHSLSSWVMRHPIWVLAPTLTVLLVVGSPFTRLRMATTDITALPPDAEARRGAEQLARFFPRESATRIMVVVEFPSAPAFTPDRARALYDLSRRVAALPGVSRVESIVDLDPSLGRETYARMAGAPRRFLPPEFGIAAKMYLADRVTVLYVLTAAAANSPETQELVRRIRADRTVGDGRLWVGGQTANDLDAMAYIRAHTPAALGFVMAMTALVLFFLLGSVVLPLKALAMNLLSIAGSFGALVWIFQEGHLRNILRFEPGPIEPSLPILLFCAVFGLSMDYEVLLLSRIQEEYRRSKNNAHSVAEGLERSGGLITSAAAIMVAVFAAFTLATVVVVKAMGLGMAVAVALDATLIRVLIVPATMRLFGDLNWWAPAPLARLFAAAHRSYPSDRD
jgi:RND superfamily putative drug exporter